MSKHALPAMGACLVRNSSRLPIYSAEAVFSQGVGEVWLVAILSALSDTVGYRQGSRGRSTVRNVEASFDASGMSKRFSAKLFDFALSALYFSHEECLIVEGFYMQNYLIRLISQYASKIRVKHLVCSRILRPSAPVAFEAALFYAAFGKFAYIEAVTCKSCSAEVETELRNLCQAKQITFTAM